jgi:glycosyltransferase involved in cell wall biosynthesis
MQRIADRFEIDSIYFMGFQTRQDIAKFYSLADLLVLPSHKETWGMVVNEGLCFSLPVVLSDQVGSRADLVTHGENGYVFSAGDVSDLTVGLSTVVDLSEEDRSKMGKKSKSVIVDWTERDIASVLVDYFESSGSDSNTKVIRMLLKIYRWLPEFVAHLLAVSIISSLWGAGQLFLMIRPVIRRLRAALLRFRG